MDPKGGGPAEALRQMIKAMGDVHSNEVVTLDPPGVPWLTDLPFRTYPLGEKAGLGGYRYTPELVPWIVRNAANYDAVIVHGLWQYHGFATWMALKHTDVPYYVYTHGMLDPWFKRTYPLKHLKKWLYWPWAEYRVLRDAKAVFFTSEEERRLARQSFRLYRCNERVVPYGTAAPSGMPEIQIATFLNHYPELKGKRILLFLSRIHEKKGCDILIEAFASIAGRDHALHLVMAGPDQTGWKKDLVALSEKLGISKRITWTGMLSGDMKWGAYHASEVFVLPSHQENFGVVVAEALACGLPVLISNKVNIWREIEADGAGLVCEDDVDGTLRILQKWDEMGADQRSVMKNKTYDCFNSRFEIGRVAIAFIEVVSRGNATGKEGMYV